MRRNATELPHSRACRPYDKEPWRQYAVQTVADGNFTYAHIDAGFTLRADTGTTLRSKWVEFNISSKDFELIAQAMFRADPDAAASAFARAMLQHIDEK